MRAIVLSFVLGITPYFVFAEEYGLIAEILAPKSNFWTNEVRWKDIELDGKKGVQLTANISYPWLSVKGKLPNSGQVIMEIEHYSTDADKGFAIGLGGWGSPVEMVLAKPKGWHTTLVAFQVDILRSNMKNGMIHTLVQGGGENGPIFNKIVLREPKKGEVLQLFKTFIKDGTKQAWMMSKLPPFVESTEYDEKVDVNPSEKDKKTGAIPFVRSYLRFIYPSTVPEFKERGTKGEIVLTPGEYEPFQFAINALKDFNELNAEVVFQSDRRAIAGPSTELYWVESVPKRFRGSRSNTYRIQPNRLWPKEIFPTCEVKQGASQAWWLIVKAADNMTPGTYPLQIVVKNKGTEVAVFDVNIRVLPFSLPKKLDTAFFLCESNHVIEESIIADLSNHGQNGMSAWSEFQPVVDGKIDFAVWDAYFATLKKYGIDNMFFWYLGNTKSGNSVLGSVGMPMFIDLLKGINERVKDGRYPKYFALTVDEAVKSNNAFNDFKELGQLIKLHAPNLKIQGTSLDDHSLALRYQGLIDVLACNGSIPQNSKWCKEQKIDLSTYSFVSSGVEARLTRLNYGFYPWQYDAKGVNGWSMRWNNGHPYNDLDGGITDWGIFLPSWIGAPISTPSWEGFREGVDDQRYLFVYEELVKAGKADGSLLKELKEKGVSQIKELSEKVVGDSEFGAVIKNSEDLQGARERVILEILKALNKN